MTKLFIAEPTGTFRRELRRYSLSKDDGHYHAASATIVELPVDEGLAAHGDNWPHDDPRWPTQCSSCEYRFADDDAWQRNDNLLYRAPDGETFVNFGSNCRPVGAMIRATWHDGCKGWAPGEAWLIQLPNGASWITTQPSSAGHCWTVTGVPPQITVTPSINAPGQWHGFIRDGELIDA